MVAQKGVILVREQNGNINVSLLEKNRHKKRRDTKRTG
jgi:hypothetical protein